MACSVCAANVERKLNSLDGINSATVSLAGRTALVDFNPEQITLEDMKREISNAGYDLVIEENRSAEEINRRELTLLKRKTILVDILPFGDGIQHGMDFDGCRIGAGSTQPKQPNGFDYCLGEHDMVW